MNLPVPPSQARNVLSEREQWVGFVRQSVLLWKNRLTAFGPDELRTSRDDLRDWIERWEGKAEEVLCKTKDLAREIAAYAGLDERESVQRLRRIVSGLPREMPPSPGGEVIDLWEGRSVFSEAAPGDQKEIERLEQRYSSIRRGVQRKRFSLRIVEHVHAQYLSGALEVGEGSRKGISKTSLHQSTEKYLRTAYQWIEAGYRPSGDKPTELWKHIHRQTGKSKDTIRSTFKNRGWYDPYGDPSPTMFTVRAVLKAAEEHLR